MERLVEEKKGPLNIMNIHRYSCRLDRTVIFLLTCAMLLLLPCGGLAQDSAPALVNYQGRLTGSDGNPVSNTTYDVELSPAAN